MTKSLGRMTATSKSGCVPEIKWNVQWKNVCLLYSVITGAVGAGFQLGVKDSMSLFLRSDPGARGVTHPSESDCPQGAHGA